MTNWNVPDNITLGQQPPHQPMTPYAAYRAKHPLETPQTQQVAAPVPQPPRMPGVASPQPRAIGYGAPGNPRKPWGV